jgi:uroporphyrinogen III methyltransferase/synthase
LRAVRPGEVELITITTSGDDAGTASRTGAQSAGAPADKSRWVDTIEQALLTGEIDLAVHSAKDVPGELAEGLALLGAPARAGAEDVLCGAPSLEALPAGANVGTSSVRRAAQLHAAREDLQVVSIGGNVDTRLRLLDDGQQTGGRATPTGEGRNAGAGQGGDGLDAIVLARAGLQRLGREGEVGAVLDIARFVPAPGQGILALEGRADDTAMQEAVRAITDADAFACLQAERALARELDASCHTPLGAYAVPAGCGCLNLRAWVGLPDGSAWCSDELLGGFYDPEALGRRVAERMKAAGADELLRRSRETHAFGAGRFGDASGASVALIGPRFGQRRSWLLSMPEVGRVYLVGAGPGDPGLLTARALELIASADVILYDRLIPSAALDGARANAEVLFVGKEGGGQSVPQEETEELMLARAKAGKQVVRLKGGDPFVFGRGGEEALALREAGIPFEIVPGVTSGVAAAAYAGIPLTHRGLATAVALVTGHTRADGSDDSTLDWPALAMFPGTLVFYMGVRQLPQITESLIAAGRHASERVAIVERGTLPDQRTVVGTLQNIAEIARREEVQAPSITVVGAVAGLAEQLEWREDGIRYPLAGKTVAVTRARAQASGLARRLEELGAGVVQAPVIRTQPLPVPPLDLAPYDLVCFTSPNAVTELFDRFAQADAPSLDPATPPERPAPGPDATSTAHSFRDARAFAGSRVAAIGPGTAHALAEHGILADIVPERAVAESLVQALTDVPVAHALVARAKEAREEIPDALRARGAEVDVLALYETVAEPLSPRALAAAQNADYITFTSSSTVRFFLDAAGGSAGLSPATRIVSIGPVTSATLREHSLEAHVEAAEHDVDGVVQALLTDVAARAV